MPDGIVAEIPGRCGRRGEKRSKSMSWQQKVPGQNAVREPVLPVIICIFSRSGRTIRERSEAVYVLAVLSHEINVIAPAILEKCTDLVHSILLPATRSGADPCVCLCSLRSEEYAVPKENTCQRRMKNRQILLIASHIPEINDTCNDISSHILRQIEIRSGSSQNHPRCSWQSYRQKRRIQGHFPNSGEKRSQSPIPSRHPGEGRLY